MKDDQSQSREGTVVDISHGSVHCRVLVTNPNDSIQKYWFYNKTFYEVEALDLIARFAPAKATILDVGANYGNHTLFFARGLDAHRVIPIEPNPKAVHHLLRNLSLNELGNVDVSYLGVAVGARSSRARLELSELDAVTLNEGGMQVIEAPEGEVPVVPLDELLGEQRVDLVKIDVEGMEVEVLQGMSQLIARWRPTVFVEVRDNAADEVRRWQEHHRYALCGAVQMYAGMINLLLVPEKMSPQKLAERTAELEARLTTLTRRLPPPVAEPLRSGRPFLLRQSDRVRRRLGPWMDRVMFLSDRIVARELRRRWPAAFVPRHKPDTSDVVPTWRPRYDAATGKPVKPRGPLKRVSVIATTLDERATVESWLDAMARQSVRPDEIVVVDAGSVDGTASALRDGAAARGLNLNVLEIKGANIATGRNIAIRAATHDIIAATDLGCVPTDEWLEHLTAPFVAMPQTAVVAGATIAGAASDFQAAVAPFFVPYIPQIDPNSFLPSSRSIAFTRAAWQAVGGYPEWLTFAGEDTYFAISLRNLGAKWAFSPGARVIWEPRRSLRAIRQQVRLYGFGDGEGGMSVASHREDIIATGSAAALAAGAGGSLLFGVAATTVVGPLALFMTAPVALLAVLAAVKRFERHCALYREQRVLDKRTARLHRRVLPHILVARGLGFLEGHRARFRAARRRFASCKGTVLILSGVPFDDSGGGQRPAMIARELARRDWRVIFVSFYPKYESAHVKVDVPPNLETFEFAQLDRAYLADIWASAPRRPDGRPRALCLVEYPEPRFLELFRAARAAGLTTVYDCIDLWESSLGAGWYLPTTERQFARLSDVVISSASLLQRHAAELGGPRPELVPNAVDITLFRHGRHPRPRDMNQGAPTVLYVGSLWGDWFDWDLLRGVAEALPEACFVIVGDYRGQMHDRPANVKFLGLKPQAELPAYLANADVGIIPFDTGRLIQAVSPLKAFEYLAMGLPVVATPMAELAQLPHVRLAVGVESFAAAILAAPTDRPTEEQVRDFIDKNSWSARVDALLRATQQGGEADAAARCVDT